MARPIVLGNGELHVGLNKYGLVHDFYFPYVGYENHAAGANLRHKVGVWIDGTISWLDDEDAWTFRFRYPHTALIGHTLAKNEQLQVMIEFDDCVDAEMSVFMRNIHVINLADQPREIRVYMYQPFAIGDGRSNTDTVQYLPDSDAILHYRGRRTFIVSGSHDDKPFDQYSVGLFGIDGHEGSFRDAEDGQLDGNNVEYGRVDSIIGFTLQVAAQSSERVHYWVTAGMSTREALFIHRQIQEKGVLSRLHHTADWWHRWLAPVLKMLDSVPPEHRELFIHSVMVVKSQMDKRGAVIASTDSTLLNYSLDAYAYSWNRDAAYAVWPLIRLGYKDEPYRFFDFSRRVMHPGGYVMQKYRADGALGSSWHPYVHGQITAPPIQEDETALTVFVFAQFYQAQKDASLLKDFYASMVVPMADFLADYTDHRTGLPKPSYDLWEEHFMTTTYTTAVTYAALEAAAELAIVVGDEENSVKWHSAAADIQAAAHKHLYNEQRRAFYKGIAYDGDNLIKNETIDSSATFGAYMFGLFDADSPEVQSAITTTHHIFGVSPEHPGLPRYENDVYRRESDDVTGNWWPITTLWGAQYRLDIGDEAGARAILDWVKDHAQYSGMLSEQVNPVNDDPISPAPLTWSHAEYLSTWIDIVGRNHE